MSVSQGGGQFVSTNGKATNPLKTLSVSVGLLTEVNVSLLAKQRKTNSAENKV